MKMSERIRCAISLVALSMAMGTSTLQGQLPPLSSQAAIITLRHEWNVAMTQRDTARLGRLILDDAPFLSADVHLVGRDQVTEVFERLFASFPDFRMVFAADTLVPARPVATDSVVSEYGAWQEVFSAPGGTVVLRGTYYDIWRRTPEGWRIAVHGFARTSCTGNPTYCRSR
jgi:ketosteroid isomerase-like protein